MSERSVQQPVVPNLQRASNDQRSSECNVLHQMPANEGPTAHATFRVTFVTPPANVRSVGFTTAMTQD